ncbi:hypothetical protein ACIBCR_02430 [Micromonospora echinospora]|uniref:hypothetical protein n=1 Tax=Micromonospora echinospora TaxID=1877 RepID=UPI0037BE1EDD
MTLKIAAWIRQHPTEAGLALAALTFVVAIVALTRDYLNVTWPWPSPRPEASTPLPTTDSPSPTETPVPTTPGPSVDVTTPAPQTQDWKERWAKPIQVRFSLGIDFDALPPPGRQGFGADLKTGREGTDLRTEGSGKLVVWDGERQPEPQQCFELLATLPAEGSQYVGDPTVGRWYCLLTWNGSNPGRVVVFSITEAIDKGFGLQATVWNRGSTGS